MKRWLSSLAVVFILAGNSAKAQTDKDGPMAKLTHSLVALHGQYTSHLAQRSTAPFSSSDPLLRLVGDRVVVDAVASGDADALKADLLFLGMQEAVAFGRIVSGQLPISAIPAAAALTSLRFAQSAAAITSAGNVTSQGDQAMGSNVARTTFGVDGTGVTVGVLSDSFNCLGGASANVASGDLSPVAVLQEEAGCISGTDEGRAMLQIVHDVAPGASLSFASAFNGMASFATNIQALAAAGAKVIVDDTIYFAEPMFQDGIVAQAVDNVVAGGAAYFSSAGNQARQSYQGVFRPGDFLNPGEIPSAPGAPSFLGGTAHNFNSGGGEDHFQSVTVPVGTRVTLSLQWDSPFFSVSGASGTQNDLDIYVLDASATQILAGSTSNNIGGDAVEVFGIINNGPATTFNLMIVKHSGADPGLIKYVYFFSGSPPSINEFDTQSSTIFGHANAVGAEAVGAARYTNTPAFGVSPPVLESFSSSGSTPILFDLAGNPVSDLRADKPEIVAPDGVDTTFFGSPDFDGTGFPNFFGTSAAAPHAAAVAALILQAKPALIPAKVYESLETTAINMVTPGFDNDSGFGLIQADAAVEAALTESPTFVRQQYLDFLDREPDSGGLAAWVNALDSGLPKASLIEAFMNSAEIRFKGKFIAQAYLGILTRDADHGGFRAWLGALLAGASREQIVQGFLNSGEFQVNFGSSLTNGQFVERMYNNVLLRSSDSGGFNFWVGQLNSGQMTRAQVALSFLDSAEFQNLSASQNRVTTSLLYFDMLRRDPDAGGFAANVGTLNAGVPLTSVIDGFLNSAEYQARTNASTAVLNFSLQALDNLQNFSQLR